MTTQWSERKILDVIGVKGCKVVYYYFCVLMITLRVDVTVDSRISFRPKLHFAYFDDGCGAYTYQSFLL